DPFSYTQNKIVNGNTQTANQTNIDNVIGPLSYDMGHVFCTGDGGIADLEGLCDPGHEARAATGRPNPVGDAFDVDYVVHEMGHQLGAEHTFNYNGSGCNPHARANCAYEPGSGSTIMAYAGLCSGNNIQYNSDDYFHAKSLDQIITYISGLTLCGSTSPAANSPSSVPVVNSVYDIPKLTPFEIEAPQATDPENETVTYCWEEYDLGDFGKGLVDTKLGPIFRSFRPTTSRWRVFPVLDSIRRNVLDYPGEKLPEVTRTMNFRLTVRDMHNGEGAYNWSDSTLKLNVTDQAGPFLVLEPNKSSDYWRIGNSYTVKWDVANTNAAPVSCSNVDILLSMDDGQTYPYTLATGTPNDGSEVITVPAGAYTASARVKIKGSGNVFFDISNASFIINDWPDTVHDLGTLGQVDIYPIPAKGALQVKLVDGGNYSASIHNTLGQQVWEGKIEGNTSVNLGGWAAGVYHLTLISRNGDKMVKKFVVE
ncbi:MAG: zinc-dependent metalloprotease, partial [Chitinophagaceae bacterium]|nr:zinc-dependent metalloprotease [Chitinophagaceae bacterium]